MEITDNQLQIFSFGEKREDKWYAHSDGKHVKCDENTIDHLWKQWLMNPTAEKADDEKYTIFKVVNPPMWLDGTVNNDGKLIR